MVVEWYRKRTTSSSAPFTPLRYAAFAAVGLALKVPAKAGEADATCTLGDLKEIIMDLWLIILIVLLLVLLLGGGGYYGRRRW
jgi:hypothetical protein